MDKTQLRSLIERILKHNGLYSESAVELLMLTAAVESNLGKYIKQVNGPALGIFQMEPATAHDIWMNYLSYRKDLSEIVESYRSRGDDTCALNLEFNLGYQILMARVHYLRVPKPLPTATDIRGLAEYWKKYYNTKLGKGTINKAIDAWARYCS